MKKLIHFLSSGRVWMNVLLIIIFVGLVLFLTVKWLGMYTQHGDSITVPDIQGSSLSDLEVLLGNSDMTFEVTDSIYTDAHPRGVVVSQNPVAGKQVKKGRTIYLTINSFLPEMVVVPDLIGKSKRIASPILEITGLKLDKLKYRPDETCTDCVVGLEYRGKPISSGDRLQKGEKVVLVLGQRSEETTVAPDLLGLTYQESSEIIFSYSLNVGSILSCSGCITKDDSASAFVVNQRPYRNEMVKLGTFVDLYLSTDSTMAAALRTANDSIKDETE
jgi:beta-lactam-binding protein with PASTA domain